MATSSIMLSTYKYTTPTELEEIVYLKLKKVPGEDGITVGICQQAPSTPSLGILSGLLEEGQWYYVILRKPGKPYYTNPKSYMLIG